MSLLPEPDYKQTLNYADGTNADIIDTIHKNFPRAVQQTKQFAQRFKGANARQTAYNVWKFIRNYKHYRKDSKEQQLIRLPSRFLHEPIGGDCKSYALTIASLLANNGLPVRFRYAGYEPLTSIPSHVYVVTKDEQGRDIVVDGVWKYFDSEKKPTFKFDRAMNVYTLSGTEDIGRHRRRRRGRFKKILLAPARRAYRTMVSLNIMGMARKLAHARKRNPSAVRAKWEKMGGKYSALEKSIKKGYNHWARKHHEQPIQGIYYPSDQQQIYTLARAMFLRWKQQWLRNHHHRRKFFHAIKGLSCCAGHPVINGNNDIGAIALAPIITAAAPIIIAFAPLLKATGADEALKEGEATVNDTVSAAKEAVTAFNEGTKGNPDAPHFSSEDPTQPDKADEFDAQPGKDDEPEHAFKPSPLLIGGAAVALLLLFTSKKSRAA